MTMLAEGRVKSLHSPVASRSYRLWADGGYICLNGTTLEEVVQEAQTRLAGRYFTEKQQRDVRIVESTGNTIIARLYCLAVKEWEDDFAIGRFACVFIFFFATSSHDAFLKAREINRPGINRFLVGPDDTLND